ncbi:MAG TPA: MOSC domain-containing protein, partial [Thermoguttaceae bacterium]
MGRVEAVCTSHKKGQRKSPVPVARLVAGQGIEGDAHAGPWHRQISILAAEDVEQVRHNGLADIKHGDFAENLVLSGVDLDGLGLGSRLRFGSQVELSITQLG